MATLALASDAHAGDRASRRVSEPRRFAACSRAESPAGNGGQVITRRQQDAPRSATDDGRIAPRAGRSRCRTASIEVGHRRVAGFPASS